MRVALVVAIVASGAAIGTGLAVAPVAAVAPASGGDWRLPHYLTSELASSKARPSGYLGSDIAISGNTVVVGANGTRVGEQTNAGAIYVFTRSKSSNGRLTQRAVITLPGEEGFDEVGPVAVSGKTIVVGAEWARIGTTDTGAAYVFDKPASGWKSTSHPTARLTFGTAVNGAHVGASVAITGNTVVVGAPEQTVGLNPNQGAVLVFTKPAHGWRNSSKPAELTSSAGTEDDGLGQSVAISGGTIVAGAPGRAISTHDDAGVVDVFVKPHSGGWATKAETRELDPKPAITDLGFGSEVAVARGQIAVAAEGDDNPSNLVRAAAFEFNRPSAGWGTHADPPLHPKAKLTSSFSGPYDAFGQSIAISGSMIVVGAPYASLDRKYDSGGVYIFDKPKHGWHTSTHPKQFIAASTERWDSFGYAVALSGTTIAVGAPYSDYTGAHNSADRGTAYVFTKRRAHHASKTEVAK